MSPDQPPRKRILTEGWLATYRRYIIRQESPDEFHFWVGCQLISASLKRNVWVDRGSYVVYPNQYVFFIAKSGLKKSAAMDIGLPLIKELDSIRILYGRMTVEGLIDYLDHSSIGPDGRIKPDGSVLIQADELAYIFGKQKYTADLLDFLTAAYSSKTRLDFLTRNKGFKTVMNPCISLMSACTLAQMGDIFPSLTLVSGFLARVLLICGIRKGRVAKPEIDKSLEDALIHDLGCMSQLYGVVRLTDEAEEFFVEWYENMADAPHIEMEAYWERRHDHVLKAALILSISESSKMVITIDHLQAAIKAIEHMESFYPEAISSIGITTQATTTDMIVSILKTVYPNPMSRSVLLRRIYRRLSGGAQEFDMLIDDLKQQKKVREIVDTKRTTYVLIPDKSK